MDNQRIDLHFYDQSEPLDRIINTSDLPTIIRFDPSQQLDSSLVSPEFDPTQTLLLHSKYKCRRVQARNAHFQPDTKSFQDTGLDVTLDEKYTGWFAVFGNPIDNKNDPVVPHFRNIGKLAISPCLKFLVSGKQPIEAMKILRHTSGKKTLKPFQVDTGTVLTKVGMYNVSLVIKVKKSLFKKKAVKKDEMYLSCRDDLNNEMLISCQTQGIFYVLSQQTGQIRAPVMKMADIVSRYRFPLLVKLVHGETIQMPQTSRGTFVLLKSSPVETSCVSTLFSPLTLYFETTADTSIRFFKATNAPDYWGDDAPRVLENCLNKVYLTLQTIRFRQNGQGVTSARSSATSSGVFGSSDEDERFDWSKVSVDSNSPFLESIDISDECKILFTHHNNDKSHGTLPTNLTQRKEKATQIKTKAITRTKMYESPTYIKETIPITTTQRRSSSGNQSSDVTKEHSYTNESAAGVSPPPPPPPASAPKPNIERDEPQNVYCEIWSDSDRSSIVSDESLEVVVENVTIASIPVVECNGYVNLTNSDASVSESRDMVIPLTPTNSIDFDGHTYDTLAPITNRDSRHSYIAMGQQLPDLAYLVRPQISVDHQDDGIGYPSHTTTDSNVPVLRSDSLYDEPFNRTYDRPKGAEQIGRPPSSTYEIPNNAQFIYNRTIENGDSDDQLDYHTISQRTSSVIYEEPTGTYERPGDVNYPRQTSSTYEIPKTNNHGGYKESNQSDVNHYERVEDIYETLSDVPRMVTPYYNLSVVPTPPNDLDKDQSHYVKASSCEDLRSDSSNRNRVKTDSGVYMNIPSSCSEITSGIVEKLMSNMKNLGLKPSTQQAFISANQQKLESSLEGDDVKNQLSAMFPDVSKIDLNKISLFLDGL